MNNSQRNDTKHNATQRNDTKHNITLHNDTQHIDTQHRVTQHNDTQHIDTQHNGQITRLSITFKITYHLFYCKTACRYAEGRGASSNGRALKK